MLLKRNIRFGPGSKKVIFTNILYICLYSWRGNELVDFDKVNTIYKLCQLLRNSLDSREGFGKCLKKQPSF